MAIDYKLDDLGWFEFEQLVQALVKARLGMGVEAWGGRGDWGRDAYFNGKLRYPTTDEIDGLFVFQCKFVESANAAGAKPEKAILGAVQNECGRIRFRLKVRKWTAPPRCYGLFTNAPFTPELREAVRTQLAKVLPQTHISVHDGGDVCQWLRLSPEIVRGFPQMLSLRDLQELLRDVVHSDIITRSQTAISLARAHAGVFVPTSAYHSARDKLTKHGFVILEGPPEMGKTTIGRIIALSQIVSEWEAIECRSPTDVLKTYRHDNRQVFVADDFFGRTEYEPMRVSEWQSELAHILPLLGRTHWLILTCRAHLLEMAKANLDVAGQNDRFPSVGEVVVNAGDLTPVEKARILYRHAKAAVLTRSAKEIVKKHVTMIVNDRHFTPERARRLVAEYIPEWTGEENLSEDNIVPRILEALSNPTKQMRVSFRTLPPCHRWMLFALLEADHSRSFSGTGHDELQARYDALCPPDVQQPHKRVLDELTEAFVRKSSGLFADDPGQIHWIHPSCRDLAIDELSKDTRDRQRFLTNCSDVGLALATSLAGGAEGQRQLPLLQTEGDWRGFAIRAKEIVQENVRALCVIWKSFQALKDRADMEPALQKAAMRFAGVMKDDLFAIAVQALGKRGYSNPESLNAFFEMCTELRISPDIDLAGAWAVCMEDVAAWVDGTHVIWQDDAVPERVAEFLSILNEHHPAFFESEEHCHQLKVALGDILQRTTQENKWAYGNPESKDEASERADGFENLQESLEKMADLPFWTEEQRKSLGECAVRFSADADALREGFSPEPDDDDTEYEPPTSDRVNINDLFRDL